VSSSPHPSPLRFDDRVILVTGSGRGLGRAYAIELAGRGARVVVNDLGSGPDGHGAPDASLAQLAVDEIRAAGGCAIADPHSVATREGAEGAVELAVSTWGRLDAVVHNAGVVRRAPIEDMRDVAQTDVHDVSQLGAFHHASAAWSHQIDSRSCRMVLTASGAGLFGAPQSSNYAAAKMGTVGLALSLAQEGEPHGIQVNAVVPIAQTRLATTLPADVIDRLGPHQVAPVVAWLCHPDCEVNGEIFSAAGGRINRVVLAITPGVQLEYATVEGVRESLTTVRSLEDARVVSSSAEALRVRLPESAEHPATTD
jgi:NAD(P)-dependent dehydrogenase (short-subunit alcohol dehydrogenase family)